MVATSSVVLVATQVVVVRIQTHRLEVVTVVAVMMAIAIKLSQAATFL
jgi:hypothetical protein